MDRMHRDPGDAPAPPRTGTEGMGVRVDLRRDGDRVQVAVHGEADALTSPGLTAQLFGAVTATTSSVVVDLTGLRFCDLAGADALHAFVDHAAWSGVPVTLRGMSPLIRWLYRDFAPSRSGLAQGPPAGAWS